MELPWLLMVSPLDRWSLKSHCTSSGVDPDRFWTSIHPIPGMMVCEVCEWSDWSPYSACSRCSESFEVWWSPCDYFTPGKGKLLEERWAHDNSYWLATFFFDCLSHTQVGGIWGSQVLQLSWTRKYCAIPDPFCCFALGFEASLEHHVFPPFCCGNHPTKRNLGFCQDVAVGGRSHLFNGCLGVVRCLHIPIMSPIPVVWSS